MKLTDGEVSPKSTQLIVAEQRLESRHSGASGHVLNYCARLVLQELRRGAVQDREDCGQHWI